MKKKEKAKGNRKGNKGEGKGKGKQNPNINFQGEQQYDNYQPQRGAPDCENAGVAIAIKNKWVKYINTVQPINGRVMYITLNAAGGKIAFIAAYAPTAQANTEQKEKFYDTLTNAIGETQAIYYIGGDFNARIWNRREGEKEQIGPNLISREADYVINNMSEESKENRSLFLNFLQTHEAIALNTWFDKPPEKLVTYPEKNDRSAGEGITDYHDNRNGPPYDYRKYAQCDYILTRKEWNNSVLDCESDIYCPLSDHFPVTAKIQITLEFKDKTEDIKVKQYIKPNREDWERYNNALRNEIKRDMTFDQINEKINKTAEENLREKDREIIKPYITQSTWELIQKRDKKVEEKALKHEITELNKQIKKEARKDKKQHLLEQFNENPADKNKKELWKSVKGLKSKYQPKFIKMKDKNGRMVPINKRAEAIAEYLEEKHWNNQEPEQEPEQANLLQGIQSREEEYTLEEYNCALNSTKNGKQPGPDGVTMELLRWMDKDNRVQVLTYINKLWEEEKAPKEMFKARVVPIYKKGPTDEAENYRPISLLSSIYKIYMILIRVRIQKALEKHICTTQYGFRQNKSTSHALYIIRRVQDSTLR